MSRVHTICHANYDDIEADYTDSDESDEEFEKFSRHVYASVTYVQCHYDKRPKCTSILSGRGFMDEINIGNPAVCYDLFRMYLELFHHLCAELRRYELIQEDVGDVGVEQPVAMFLFVVGHNGGFRVAESLSTFY